MTLVEPSSRSLGLVVAAGLLSNRTAFFGGFFVNRAQAFKYVLRENGHHPETIVELPREIELDIPADPQIIGKGGTRSVKRLSFAARPTNEEHDTMISFMRI